MFNHWFLVNSLFNGKDKKHAYVREGGKGVINPKYVLIYYILPT